MLVENKQTALFSSLLSQPYMLLIETFVQIVGIGTMWTAFAYLQCSTSFCLSIAFVSAITTNFVL